MVSSSSVEQARALVGTTLRRKWRLEALIGVGGMSNVYAATHRNGRRGAVKLLSREFSQHAELRERFLREGYVANRISHPGVVSILDDDEAEDGSAFLVMELLDGESLQQRLHRAGALGVAEALFVADQVLDVLAEAHRVRVVHRDIKPGNVFLLRDGRVKVLDFGLACMLDGIEGQVTTRDGTVLGTVSYMSPEQARGKRSEIDARSDLFSVGAMLFFALSGKFVHEAGHPVHRLMAAMDSQVRSLATAVGGLPAALVAVVDRSLRFEKADRFQSAREMQAAVRAVFATITGQPIPTTQRVSVRGVRGWARPSNQDRSQGPSAGSSLNISVVFEPDPLQDPPTELTAITESDIESSLGISVQVEPPDDPYPPDMPGTVGGIRRRR